MSPHSHLTNFGASALSRLPILGLVLFLFWVPCSAADEAKDHKFFENKIRPVLVEQCYSCHSEQAEKSNKLRGGLKLDTKSALLQGGENGKAIVPGKPSEGLLLKSLKYDCELQMPSKGKLPANVIADFEQLIKDGAVDPRESQVTAKAASICGCSISPMRR